MSLVKLYSWVQDSDNPECSSEWLGVKGTPVVNKVYSEGHQLEVRDAVETSLEWDRGEWNWACRGQIRRSATEHQ